MLSSFSSFIFSTNSASSYPPKTYMTESPDSLTWKSLLANLAHSSLAETPSTSEPITMNNFLPIGLILSVSIIVFKDLGSELHVL